MISDYIFVIAGLLAAIVAVGVYDFLQSRIMNKSKAANGLFNILVIGFMSILIAVFFWALITLVLNFINNFNFSF